MSCAYSVLALCAQIVTRQKAYSEKKMSTKDAIAADNDNMEFIVSKIVTFQDIKHDLRYVIIGSVQFVKLWFMIRLIKRCDSIVIFLMLSYADTFVSQIFDNVMS